MTNVSLHHIIDPEQIHAFEICAVKERSADGLCASLCVFVCPSGSMMEYDTENMNSEEIYSSLRGVTEAIQNFSYRSQEDLNEPLRPEGKRDDAVSLFPCSGSINVCSVEQEAEPRPRVPSVTSLPPTSVV